MFEVQKKLLFLIKVQCRLVKIEHRRVLCEAQSSFICPVQLPCGERNYSSTEGAEWCAGLQKECRVVLERDLLAAEQVHLPAGSASTQSSVPCVRACVCVCPSAAVINYRKLGGDRKSVV